MGKEKEDDKQNNNEHSDNNEHNLVNLFDPADEYAELSQTALYYIGGLMDHAKALCTLAILLQIPIEDLFLAMKHQ